MNSKISLKPILLGIFLFISGAFFQNCGGFESIEETSSEQISSQLKDQEFQAIKYAFHVHEDPEIFIQNLRLKKSSVFSSANANGSSGRPTCSSPSVDPDGDGWGWEGGQSCIVNRLDPVGPQTNDEAPSCQQADGDKNVFSLGNSASCTGESSSPSEPTYHPINDIVDESLVESVETKNVSFACPNALNGVAANSSGLYILNSSREVLSGPVGSGADLLLVFDNRNSNRYFRTVAIQKVTPSWAPPQTHHSDVVGYVGDGRGYGPDRRTLFAFASSTIGLATNQVICIKWSTIHLGQGTYRATILEANSFDNFNIGTTLISNEFQISGQESNDLLVGHSQLSSIDSLYEVVDQTMANSGAGATQFFDLDGHAIGPKQNIPYGKRVLFAMNVAGTNQIQNRLIVKLYGNNPDSVVDLMELYPFGDYAKEDHGVLQSRIEFAEGAIIKRIFDLPPSFGLKNLSGKMESTINYGQNYSSSSQSSFLVYDRPPNFVPENSTGQYLETLKVKIVAYTLGDDLNQEFVNMTKNQFKKYVRFATKNYFDASLEFQFVPHDVSINYEAWWASLERVPGQDLDPTNPNDLETIKQIYNTVNFNPIKLKNSISLEPNTFHLFINWKEVSDGGGATVETANVAAKNIYFSSSFKAGNLFKRPELTQVSNASIHRTQMNVFLNVALHELFHTYWVKDYNLFVDHCDGYNLLRRASDENIQLSKFFLKFANKSSAVRAIGCGDTIMSYTRNFGMLNQRIGDGHLIEILKNY